MDKTNLVVDTLSVSFESYSQGVSRKIATPLESLSFSVSQGEILCVIGESGSGKSLMAHAILGILPDNAQMSGHIWFNDQLLDQEQLAKIRGQQICLIPQSVRALDPLRKIKKQLWLNHQKSDLKLGEWMKRLELSPDILSSYPHELSGGMLRKVLFLTALLPEPKLIIADEPTPGMTLENSVSALSVLKELAVEKQTTSILITHDVELALNFADRVAVFYQGRIIDTMTPKEMLTGGTTGWHPYTREMWHSLPRNQDWLTEGKADYA